LEELKKNVDSILVISNDRVRKLYSDLGLSEAFSKADDILATAARGIAEIITVAGYINVDFKDVNTVMKNSGVSIMGYAEAGGEDRARTAVREALNSPLLEDNDIRGAQHILLNVSSGSKEVTMEEISEITEYIEEEAGAGTDMIWGNCEDAGLGDKLSVTIIATGFDKELKEEPKTIRVVIDEDPVTQDVFDLEILESDNATIVEFENVNLKQNETLEPFVKSSSPVEEKKTDFKPAVSVKQRVMTTESQQIVRPTRPLNSPRDISELEDVPAYKRKKIVLDDTSQQHEKNSISKLSINIDENDVAKIERNNSFFHDNVD